MTAKCIYEFLVNEFGNDRVQAWCTARDSDDELEAAYQATKATVKARYGADWPDAAMIET